MVIVVDDARLREQLRPTAAVAAMRRALADAARGVLLAPPRVAADLGGGRVVFTVGARSGDWLGYRSYDTLGQQRAAQVVVLQDWSTGEVRAIAVGDELGTRRTGAIGAVAVDILARSGAGVLAVIGAGRQAWTQVWAITAIRAISELRVWRRDAGRRELFARRAMAELAVPHARAARSAEDAVRDADIVVLATSSGDPVIDASWVPSGAHVTSLGPKQLGRSEFDEALAGRADLIATDSLPQARAYDPPFTLDGTPHMDRMVGLGAVINGEAPGRTRSDQITLFCSVGLAGTEPYLLSELIQDPGAVPAAS